MGKEIWLEAKGGRAGRNNGEPIQPSPAHTHTHQSASGGARPLSWERPGGGNLVPQAKIGEEETCNLAEMGLVPCRLAVGF